ncbi:MAG: pilus assembly protein [Kordiimonadaceae bacterium]|nr:pilus assembly protein [Kordiimonadaceae bacterium]
MKFTTFFKLKNNDKGATAIEFAFAAPVLLLLLFGMFEFSRVLFTQGILNYSAEQGTRFAMVNFDHDNLDPDYIDTIKSDIEDVSRNNFILVSDENISNFDVDVITNADNTSTVNITIDYTYKMSLPLIPHSDFTLTGSSKSFLVQ